MYDEKNKIVIIAEAGVNHNGQVKNAIKLIDKAAESGADYIKFQHTNPELISPKAKKAKYQIKNTKNTESQKDMINKLHLDWNKVYKILLKRCNLKNIKFLTSAFGKDDFLIVNEINSDFIKIPSGEIVNTQLLEKYQSQKKNSTFNWYGKYKRNKYALKVLTKYHPLKKLLYCIVCLNTLRILKIQI